MFEWAEAMSFIATKSTAFLAPKPIITSTITPQITMAAMIPPEMAAALAALERPRRDPQLRPVTPLVHMHVPFALQIPAPEALLQPSGHAPGANDTAPASHLSAWFLAAHEGSPATAVATVQLPVPSRHQAHSRWAESMPFWQSSHVRYSEHLRSVTLTT